MVGQRFQRSEDIEDGDGDDPKIEALMQFYADQGVSYFDDDDLDTLVERGRVYQYYTKGANKEDPEDVISDEDEVLLKEVGLGDCILYPPKPKRKAVEKAPVKKAAKKKAAIRRK